MRRWSLRTNRELWSLTFGFPRRDILIVNSRHGEYLPEVFAGLSVFHYDPRVRPPFWCLKFWILRLLAFNDAPHEIRTILSIVRTSGVRRIVSMDAYSDLLDVEKYARGAKLFWIQHGLYLDQSTSVLEREAVSASRTTNITLLAIGEYDRANYRRWGATGIRTVPVGTLNNGVYSTKTKAKEIVSGTADAFDICLVEKGLKVNPKSDYSKAFRDNWDSFLPVFAKYLHAKNPRLIVAVSNSSERPSVIRYLSRFLEYDFTITDQHEDFATYRASDSAKITIGIASTVLVESLSRKKKVLSFNCTPYNFWDFPGSKFIRLSDGPRLSLDRLTNKIDLTMSLTWSEYSQYALESLRLFATDSHQTIAMIRAMVTGGND